MKHSVLLHSLLFFPLSGGNINRFEKDRKADGFLQTRLTADASPSLLVCHHDKAAGYDSTVFVSDEARPGQSWLLPLGAGGGPIIDLAKAVFVGEDAESRRSIFVTAPENVDAAALGQGAWVRSRTLMGHCDSQQLAVLGLALSSWFWPASVRFCPQCGGPLTLRDHGSSQLCPPCKLSLYPPINPAMIVCVLDGKGNVLLSQRKRKSFKSGDKVMRTVLSGFVSHGESMEDTVAREVKEESNADVSWVRYVGSQPWPYPYQLMTGYYALAERSPSLTVDKEELVSVGWFAKEEVRRALAGEHPTMFVPPRFTAAGVLLSAWVDGRVNDRGEDPAGAPSKL